LRTTANGNILLYSVKLPMTAANLTDRFPWGRPSMRSWQTNKSAGYLLIERLREDLNRICFEPKYHEMGRDRVLTARNRRRHRQDLNLSPISCQAIAPLAVASIAKCVALQMRCIQDASNGSN
jgi:hypothetical protein